MRDEKHRDAWGLGFFPSLLLWRERGEEGGGSECILLPSCPEGVSALAAERGMKAALSPCRHAGLGWLMLCWPITAGRTERISWYIALLLTDPLDRRNLLGFKVEDESVDRKHVPL